MYIFGKYDKIDYYIIAISFMSDKIINTIETSFIKQKTLGILVDLVIECVLKTNSLLEYVRINSEIPIRTNH